MTAVPIVGGVAVVSAVVVATTGDDGVVLCPVRRCTGGYCPGCGGVRAARRLVVGDLDGAWSHHPWVVLLAAQVVVLAAVLTAAPSSRRRVHWRSIAVPVAVVNAALALGVWGVRLADGSIPAPV